MIRVIGGKYKGKRLRKVPGTVVRPVPDKLKESLFSIIQEDVKGCVFLDGFAGTGSVGIEALSRGAKKIVFIDEHYPAIKTIKTNVAKLEANENVHILHNEFNRGVIHLSKGKLKFDLIFLDPPYKLLEERNPLKVIRKREILADTGKIILRKFYKTKFDTNYFHLQRRVTIGDDTLLFYT
jgi:16S rRNA (guanine966-N2)-methyltransferase